MQQTFVPQNTKTEKSIEKIRPINGHFKGSYYSNIAKRMFPNGPKKDTKGENSPVP